ncbi:MAG: transposase [Dehalococcoidia bacterium]
MKEQCASQVYGVRFDFGKPKYTTRRCETKYIALDCHKQYDHATVVDTETGETKSRRLAHIKGDFREFIGDRAATRVVIESCRDWSRTYELVEDLVEEIILAHPLKAKAIASAKIKTDKIDSQILARLLMANLVPQAHLRKGDNRIKQKMIRHRAFWVVMRTRVKCRIHDLVDSQLWPPEVLKAKPRGLFSKEVARISGVGQGGGQEDG